MRLRRLCLLLSAVVAGCSLTASFDELQEGSGDAPTAGAAGATAGGSGATASGAAGSSGGIAGSGGNAGSGGSAGSGGNAGSGVAGTGVAGAGAGTAGASGGGAATAGSGGAAAAAGSDAGAAGQSSGAAGTSAGSSGSAGSGGAACLPPVDATCTCSNPRLPACTPLGCAAILDVTVGTAHTCVVAAMPGATSGHVLCWGDNTYGQLGAGCTTPSATSTPTLVPGLADVVAVAASSHATFALTATGALWAWGGNGGGELGLGTTDALPHEATMIAVASPMGGAGPELRAGRMHGCVNVGTVTRCWGDNALGQLGTGSTSMPQKPVQSVIDGQHVAVGGDETCIFTTGSNAGATCVGKNHMGQLGRGNATPFEAVPKKIGFPLLNVGNLFVGGDFMYLYSGFVNGGFGTNEDNQLALDKADTLPHTMVEQNVDLLAAPVAMGWRHACGRRASNANQLLCLGANDRYQAGTNLDAQRIEPGGSATPVLGVSGPFGALSTAGGVSSHTCVVHSVQNGLGLLACWGANDRGQIGDGTTVDVTTAVSVKF